MRNPQIIIGLALLCPLPASGQLRVVNYNTLDKPTTSADLALARTVFEAIAATPRNGIAKRPDIVALQEQLTLPAGVTTASRLAAELNSLFGVTTYRSVINGTGSDRLATVYDSATVTLTGSAQVFSSGPRPVHRLRFQPVGYDSPEATLYNYNAHFKAGSSSSDVTTRADEANAVRLNADALGAGVNSVYLGDFNFGSSGESGYTRLRAAGAGQAFDPLGLASWPNSGVAVHLTQSTRTTSLADGGATGGMDDRFDLQLVSSSLLDGEGLSYLGPTSAGLGSLQHSTQAFGNDGNTYNNRINATFVGRSQSADVINALHDFSDHLPVVVDYQVPAVLGHTLGSIPLTIAQGTPFSVPLTVFNAASVAAAVGADELDFSVIAAGAISGAFAGIDAALGGGVTQSLALDTLTRGPKSGLLTITSTSQGAANSFVEVPISYEVIAPPLAGDFNADGVVDAADYVVWRDGGPLANETVSPGVIDALDYAAWSGNYAATSPGAATSIPEPAAWVLATALAPLAVARRR